ncbi:MAG: hypothetical protein AAF383_14540 [Cyanobacteria bacterium P01_A01_bin.83]
MKRPSNLILLFILAIASTFLAYALGRIIFRVIAPPEIEIKKEIKSQLYVPQADFFKRIENNR